jgi:choline dehydrogenase-like flavoprotein
MTPSSAALATETALPRAASSVGGLLIEERMFDVLIVGSGAGGGTLAGELAEAGLQVLLLERGLPLPLADQNVADIDLFRRRRYHPSEEWIGTDGDPFAPQMVMGPGGNTKIWGAVLERMREQEFCQLPMQEGPGPDWELRYSDLEPWYECAEALYRVHGEGGLDATEPPRRSPYALPPRPLEPFQELLRSDLLRQGLRPYRLPLSFSESAADPSGDAECFGLDRARSFPTFSLRTGAEVLALHSSASGREIRGVEARINGQRWLFQAHQVVLAAGAVGSAVILLGSASDRHPHGLANGSGQVGRNLMRPQLTAMLQRSRVVHSGRYGPGLGLTDFHDGDRNVDYALGVVRGGGGVLQDPLFAESPPVLSLVSRLLPDPALEWLADRSVSWWVASAVRPDPDNRVSLRGERVVVSYVPNNREAHDRLVYRWLGLMRQVERDPATTVVQRAPIYPRGEVPLSVMGFSCGTCRMGSDPERSVVDLEGRSHEVANLWIVDASILPGCPAVGPGLTVLALALRTAAALRRELGVGTGGAGGGQPLS